MTLALLPAGEAGSSSGLVEPRRAHRRLEPEYFFPLAYYLAVAAVLAVWGYPPGRIAVLGLAAGVPWAQYWFWGRCPAASCRRGDALPAWRFVRKQALPFLATGLTAAATGGVGSPLLLTFVSPYFSGLAMLGDRRETRLLLGATALGVWGLSLLPPAWTGPELSSAVHVGLVALSILGLAALLAPVHAALRRRSAELAEAREDMASEALAWARNLEQVGAKVAHELKNPLSAVKALVQLGARDPAEAPSHGRLQLVEKEVTRMQEILRDYLSFTRPLQEVKTRRIELGPLVADALAVLSARADHAGVQLTSLGDAAVEADPRRLKEALLNLVANGIEATPPGGEVTVEVRPSDDQVEIRIRDTGSGMPAEVLGRLGTPFFTTREEGTGLGVVLARSVVAQHGGSLHYSSEPGRGTTVTATVPVRLGPRCRNGERAAGG